MGRVEGDPGPRQEIRVAVERERECTVISLGTVRMQRSICTMHHLHGDEGTPEVSAHVQT